MNTLTHNAEFTIPYSENQRILWIGVGAIQIAFALTGIIFGWAWTLIPIIALACAIAFAWPRAGFFMLVTLLYFRYNVLGFGGVYPADLMSFVVVAGVFFQRLVRRKRLIIPTWANKWFAIILIAFAITLSTAFDFSMGIRNWFRHAQLFSVTVAGIAFLERRDIFALIRLMLVLTAIFSIGNIITYILAGGEQRIFGPTSAFFASFAVLAALHATVGVLMSRRRSHSLGWGVLLVIYSMALMAAQTRAAMIQLVLAVGLTFILVWMWGRKSHQPYLQWRILFFTTSLGLITIVLLADWIPLFHRPSARISEVLQGHAHTVDLRMFLWKTGLHAFFDSPFMGIGLGQIARWDEFLSYWRFDIASLATRGLGAHNDFITYIAETGLLGMVPLTLFLWHMFASGARTLRNARGHAQMTDILMLWVPIAALVMAFFFRTHMFYSISGILTSLYFAFWLKFSLVTENAQSVLPQNTSASSA